VLGFVQTATENEVVCSAFLRGLLERGLKINQGVLWVIDGAKGLGKAVSKIHLGHGGIVRARESAEKVGSASAPLPFIIF